VQRPVEGWASRLRREASLARLLPYTIIVAILALNFATAEDDIYTPLLAAAPALAGIGTRQVLRPIIAGFIAAGALAIEHADNAQPRDATQLFVITGLTIVSAVAVKLWGRQQRELASAQTVAEAAQRVLLRPVPGRLGALSVAVRYRAAAEGASIGGDVYDVASTPYGVCVLVGDVCGKGLTAVRTGADILGAFRELSRTEPDLSVLATRLDATVAHSAEDGSAQPDGALFVTAVLLRVPEGGGDAEVVNCGHPAPLLLRDGKVTELSPPLTAPPLGLLELTREGYALHSASFRPGDLMLLYTDGVSETRNPEGTFYPLAERLPRFGSAEPEAVVTGIDAELNEFARPGPSDDAAMLALRYR
jgi:serine phosphatase RsbU (regulator of sigma subunit)